MQPTFMPWAGYFNLMACVDDFVFLDDVQLEKQSWQTRNRLLSQNSVNWITLPIKNTGLSQKINETTLVNEANWFRKMLLTFEQSYSKHPYFNECYEVFEFFKCLPKERLLTLNISLIKFIAKKLDINCKFYLSSYLTKKVEKVERIESICERLGASVFLAPQGSLTYLSKASNEQLSGIVVQFHDFTPVPYDQFRSEIFQSHLSIVDVVCNLGWHQSKSYVRGEFY